MDNQQMTFVVLTALIGLAIGFYISRLTDRSRINQLVEDAKLQARSSAAVEIATLGERVRAYDEERGKLNAEHELLTSELTISRNELAQTTERASRVFSLDAQVVTLLAQQKIDRQEILRLSTSEAEKGQSFQDATLRLADTDKALTDSDREVHEAKRQLFLLREESGRLNAEVKAERDTTVILRAQFQEEKDLREKVEIDRDTLSNELAEANTRRAVFEVEASRVPSLELKVNETERLLADIGKQDADLRETSGRVNAELKAERESITLLQTQFQDEKDLREKADLSANALAAELAESNERRAAFEVEAKRIGPLEQKMFETERLLGDMTKQTSDLRETIGRVNAELKSEREVLQSIRTDFLTEKSVREQIESRANNLTTEVAELNGRLTSEQTQSEEKLALLIDAKEALSNQFKALAAEILEEKSKRFSEQNQTNIGLLLDPLKIKIQEFQGKVEEVYVQEGKDRSALAEQVRQLMDLNQMLSQDAKNLTSALKGSNKTQGNWGELILERVLEASGLRKGHEYDVQESHTREDGTRAQPDVVVHLPEDRHLIVDAKVSLNAYDACVSAEDDVEREIAIKRHLDSVRAHMKGLSDKNYQVLYGLKSLDFVLMFIPIEPAFMVAITHDRDLYMEALNKNVLLVSPSTLLFVVRTVAHLWRQESQNKNAQEIAKRGAELYDRLSAFVMDLEKVGDRLRQAQDSYTDARNKLCVNKGNVIRQAEMLRELGVKPTKLISEPIISQSTANEDAQIEAMTSIEYASSQEN